MPLPQDFICCILSPLLPWKTSLKRAYWFKNHIMPTVKKTNTKKNNAELYRVGNRVPLPLLSPPFSFCTILPSEAADLMSTATHWWLSSRKSSLVLFHLDSFTHYLMFKLYLDVLEKRVLILRFTRITWRACKNRNCWAPPPELMIK